ncbi:MAG: fluoride efflux transporter CrcB [Candidatus Nanopelagicales bacterium]
MIWVVMVGAGFGAAARYALDRRMSRHPSLFPRGTFTINLLGSFLLGFIVGIAPTAGLIALLGTGFCGGFTTFSTFSYELVRLVEENKLRSALSYLAASLAVGFLAGGAGIFLAGLP